ncbi:MAG: hypothetical protein Q4F31_10695 [Eubacteriales bacterium]|nr:hypothetical protein [Eubacteriales bacterium]
MEKITKEEFEALNKKLSELTDDEMKKVSGGVGKYQKCPKCGGIMIAEYRDVPGAPDVKYRVFVCQNQYCRNEIVM